MAVNRGFLGMRPPIRDAVTDDFPMVGADIPSPPAGGFGLSHRYASFDPAPRGGLLTGTGTGKIVVSAA